jgi:hypothetical protein
MSAAARRQFFSFPFPLQSLFAAFVGKNPTKEKNL